MYETVKFVPRRLLPNGTLHITRIVHNRLNRPDEGIYQCEASVSGVGTILSKAASLRVGGD